MPTIRGPRRVCGALAGVATAILAVTGAQAAPSVELEEIVIQDAAGSGGGRGATEAALRASVVAKESATGTKTATSLLETPQSISVVTPKQWTEQGATDLNQALRYTPGVSANLNPTDTRLDSTLIRGFIAPIYLDGLLLPVGASRFARPNIEIFGLQEIDVLRGAAAGSLYGQNPPGGLVNLVSLRPTDKPIHALEGRVDSFGNARGAFDIGGPLDPQGHYLYRLTGLYNDGGTQFDFVNAQRAYVAPAFTFAPDAATTFTILAKYQRDRTGQPVEFFPPQGTLYGNPNGRIPRTRNVGEPGHDYFHGEQYQVGYLFEHQFDATSAVRQNLRYGEIRTDTLSVNGAGLQADDRTLNRINYTFPESATAFTMDNQLEKKFDTGALKHTGLLGVDYRYATSDFRMGTAAASPIDVYNPVYGAPVPPPVTMAATGQRLSQTGVYVQDQVRLGGFGLTLSGRHDWANTRTHNDLTSSTFPQSDQAFSGRAALNYVSDAGIAPYVAVARSFQPAFNVTSSGMPLKPTTGDEIEAGIKYRPIGVDALFTAAIFDVNQKNYVTPDPSGISGAFIQTGSVRIHGAELEAKASLAEGLDVVASYTHIEGRIGGTNNPALDGNSIITTPTDQAAAYLDYTFQSTMLKGFGLGAGVRYVGKSFGDLANVLKIPDYTLFDAGAHYDFAALDPRFAGARLTINVLNLADTYYVASCGTITQCYLGSARVAKASLRYTW